MALFLRQCFSCFGRRSPEPEAVNERTRLLDGQPGLVSSPPRAPTIDHALLKDRLGTIVRAKESKMVNVNTPAPFALAASSAHPSPSPSQSKSHSASHSPQRDSLTTSRSTSSLHPGDASYVPGVGAARAPVFGARLVAARRGRSTVRGRAGRFDLGVDSLEGSREVVNAAGQDGGADPENVPVDVSADTKADEGGQETHKIRDVGRIAESWGD